MDNATADSSRWSPEDAPKLVLNYLIYNCHQHTAAAFVKEWLGDTKACEAVHNSPDWRSLDYRSSIDIGFGVLIVRVCVYIMHIIL